MVKISKLEKLTFVLSLYVIVELWVSLVVPPYSQQTKTILLWIDNIICLIFLFDFFYGLFKAESKKKFFKSNWIDLISSIPTVEALRAGRIVKIIKILRIIRSQKHISSYILKKNSQSIFKGVIYLNVFLIVVFSLSLFSLESEVNPNFKSIFDSFWWAISIVLVSEYEHAYPITTMGKVMMIFLIIGGLILVGAFIAMLTDYFVKDENIEKRLDDIEKKLDKILKGKDS